MDHHMSDAGVHGNSSLTSMRPRWAAIALGVFSLVAALPCRSQDGPATPPPVKVVSASQALIRLDAIGASFAPVTAAVVEDFTPCLLPDPKGAKYACTAAESSGKQSFYKSTKLLHQADANSSGVYLLAFDEGTFALGRLYRLRLQRTDPTTHAVSTTSLSVDTSPSVAVAFEDLGSSSIKLFRLTSTLGFVKDFPGTDPGSTQKLETVAGPVDCVRARSNPDAAHISITGSGGSSHSPLSGWKMPLSGFAGDLSTANPVQIGAMALCVDIPSTMTDFTPDGSLIANVMNGIESSLGPVSWTWAPGTKLTASAGSSGAGGGAGGGSAAATTLGPSPAAKSAANFYANLNLAAATGTAFAWGLDGKISEFNQQIFKRQPLYVTWLSATANTGHNTSDIKGQVYTDTIDWTLPFSYPFSHGSGPRFGAVATLAPDYETDINFDRKNLLVAGDVLWNFDRLYQPQNKRTPAKNGALVKYPDRTIARFGYVLQFHTGFEAGGALIDTVQKASSGTAKITVPSYSIARVVPQITGNIQWIPARRLGLFTFDDTIAGRYLFDTENTVEQYQIPAAGTQPASVGLLLRPISGWKAYNTLVSTWNPPQTANFGITVTFDDGFNAPKFTRVNSVTVGVTIAY
jgi:hypothetical protein